MSSSGDEQKNLTGERSTSRTLLIKLGDPNDWEAWQEFANRYGREIYKWCRRRGLQPADAEDVGQAVALKLLKNMKKFVYNPEEKGRFRDWLKRVTDNACKDFFRSNKSKRIRLRQLDFDPEALKDVIRTCDDHSKNELHRVALEEIAKELNPRERQILDFKLNCNLPSKIIAEQLGITEKNVNIIMFRIKAKINAAIQKLGGIGDEANGQP